MDLKQKIELLHRSSSRLMEAIHLERNEAWWLFMRRETWIHLKRALETWWHVVRLKK